MVNGVINPLNQDSCLTSVFSTKGGKINYALTCFSLGELRKVSFIIKAKSLKQEYDDCSLLI